MSRLFNDDGLKVTIANELHLAREAAREMEELTKCVNWKKKEEEMSKEEANGVQVIRRWIQTLNHFFEYSRLWNEKLAGLIGSLVQMIRASRDNHKDICNGCLDSLRRAAKNRNVRVEDLLKGGAIDVILEEFQQPTLNDKIACYLLWKNGAKAVNVGKTKKKGEDEESDEEEEEKENFVEFKEIEEEKKGGGGGGDVHDDDEMDEMEEKEEDDDDDDDCEACDWRYVWPSTKTRTAAQMKEENNRKWLWPQGIDVQLPMRSNMMKNDDSFYFLFPPLSSSIIKGMAWILCCSQDNHSLWSFSNIVDGDEKKAVQKG
ncbi:uncharacterized protein MONOS_7425 [Monocercomonoides exilis]|uniref:uncharacterized protein n=1 Tax=Monocercomonoides exilis TaxID=2049356 RepID=UPI00355A9B90|nr:hypothetical protein MONOS_7425 [Monocercomonoides exilis]|eukprot:MONOS_7425.1-p1 / transcript=MONOS_7425.1 / gene=MONOS_7425 / organism=Monocercomonoides_exilis_PA203 / gene_product=unspecified product / transcript_product=unspecified product / location=Mono_scaffold00253:31678-33370(-) / protein_length=317 / sequence_SO=supercontig / SO=protein_coding / is_pseudo=false